MMKIVFTFVATVVIFASAVYAQKTSAEYVADGTRYAAAGDYANAALVFQRAVSLEMANRTLERDAWLGLITDLAYTYRRIGRISPAAVVLAYGLGQDRAYPMFHYGLAQCAAARHDFDGSIASLRLAYKYKDNIRQGNTFPDPLTDPEFRTFRANPKFKKAVAEMKTLK